MNGKRFFRMLRRRERKLRRPERRAARLRLARAMIFPLTQSFDYGRIGRIGRTMVSVECAECGLPATPGREEGAARRCGSCIVASVMLT